MRARTTWWWLTGITCGLLVLYTGRPSVLAQAPDDVVPGEWIVTLNPDLSPAQAPAIAQAAGGRAGHVYDAVLHGFQFIGSDAAAAALARSPRVRTIVPNRRVYATVQTLPAGVRRIDASHPDDPNPHELGYTGNGQTIAILDTGIWPNHPDLRRKVNYNLAMTCIGNGPDDGAGHGTHVAGTAAADDNSEGVIGVAPGATLVPVKVLDNSGSGSWASVICGINHVTANAGVIAVANMSLGGSGTATGCTDGGLHQAICQSVGAGVVYTVAAGNSRRDAAVEVPASYPEVITVSAYADYDGEPGGAAGCLLFYGLGKQCDDTFAKFSNYGTGVDVTAPGVNVYSTYLNGGYAYMSGTSMAAPHVAGVVALMRQVNSSLTPADIRNLLRATGECPDGTTNAGGGDCAGQGQWSGDPDGVPEPLVNAWQAVQAALSGGGSGGGSGSTNTPPTAEDVTASGDEDTTISWYPVVGDDDAGDQLVCTVLTQPLNGSAFVTDNCAAGTYIPDANFSGSDSFTYGVSDGNGGTAGGTVSVTVNEVVDPPGSTVHIESLAGSSVNNGSTWTAVVVVSIEDENGNAIESATVSGHWDQPGGILSCVTNAGGACQVSVANVPKRQGTVTFVVNDVVAGLPYAASDNVATSVVVAK